MARSGWEGIAVMAEKRFLRHESSISSQTKQNWVRYDMFANVHG